MSEERIVDMGEMLNITIVTANDKLKEEELDKEARKAALDEFERLYKLRISELEVGNDFYNAEEDRKLKQSEIEEQKKLNKTEKAKTWIEVGKAGLALSAWVIVTFSVMKFEETGSIRSKAFTGTIPKMKFW